MEKHILFVLILAAFVAFFCPSAMTTSVNQPGSGAQALASNFLKNVAIENFSQYDVNVTQVRWCANAYFPFWAVDFALSHGNVTESMHVQVAHGAVVWFDAPSAGEGYMGAGYTSGTTMTVHSTDTLKLTRDILASYGSCVNSSFCSSLVNSIDQILNSGSPALSLNNFGLSFSVNFSHDEKHSEFDLTALNTTQTLKMEFTPNGYLYCFVDGIDEFNWNSLNFKDLNVSREQAISIALPYMQNFTESNMYTVKSTNVTLTYIPGWNDANETRDYYSLYPQWIVNTCFDNVTRTQATYHYSGFSVTVWADDGQVFLYSPIGNEIASNPQTGSLSNLSTRASTTSGGIDLKPLAILVAAAALFFSVSTIVYFKTRRGEK